MFGITADKVWEQAASALVARQGEAVWIEVWLLSMTNDS